MYRQNIQIFIVQVLLLLSMHEAQFVGKKATIRKKKLRKITKRTNENENEQKPAAAAAFTLHTKTTTIKF